MKGIFVFCTKLKFYIAEIPLMILLAVAVHYNDYAPGLVKFYPLIVIFSVAIIFIVIYFFRGIYISYDQVSSVGPFSSKDSEFIKKDCTLVLTLCRGGRINVDLWERYDEPAFDWMKKETDVTRDVRVYHDVGIGGKGTAVRILKYFGVPENVAGVISTVSGEEYSDSNILCINVENHDTFEIHIKFLTTIV